MDSDNDYEMTQPAAKLMNWCRELAVMTDEPFMLQFPFSLKRFTWHSQRRSKLQIRIARFLNE